MIDSEGKQPGFWARLELWHKAVLLVLALPTAFLTILGIRSQFKEDLSVVVLQGEYRLQPNFHEEHFSGFGCCDGYWNAWVTNSGTATLEGVAIELPDTKAARVTYRLGRTEMRGRGDRIELGTLSPGQKVYVWAWTSRNPKYKTDDVRLPYSNGFGDVEIRTPASGFAAWWWKGSASFLFLFPTLGMVLVTFFMSLLTHKRAKALREAKKEPPRASAASTVDGQKA